MELMSHGNHMVQALTFHKSWMVLVRGVGCSKITTNFFWNIVLSMLVPLCSIYDHIVFCYI
jgi:hypothetical protein